MAQAKNGGGFEFVGLTPRLVVFIEGHGDHRILDEAQSRILDADLADGLIVVAPFAVGSPQNIERRRNKHPE